MNLGLTDKIALVAASSRGLGRAVAEELAAEGCDLVMCARGKEALDEAAAAIRAASKRKVLAIAADLSNPDDVARVADAALREYGRVDVLVTNGGGPPAGPFESHSAEAWDAARMFVQVLRSGAEDRGAVAAALAETGTYDGLVGRYEFAPDGELRRGTAIVHLYRDEGGRWIEVNDAG